MKLISLFRALLPAAAAAAFLMGTSSCRSTGAYWGVDQQYPVGNGTMYYGAYGNTDAPHHFPSKKAYKKYVKQQKKLRKQQEKARKQQAKAHRRAARHHHH